MGQLYRRNRGLNTKELNSLRFYQGDVWHYSSDIDQDDLVFFKTERAYQVLNMLLYPGIENEISRIKKEHKKIPIQLLKNLPQIFSVYEDIFSAMCKYRILAGKRDEIYLYRKDRMQSMDAIRNNCSYSWTSCSIIDEIDESFQKKDGILLLEYKVPVGIPHIVINEVLGQNMYQYQHEVLLPPFLVLKKSELDITEKEMEYRDINGNPPKAKYLLDVKEINLYVEKINGSTREEIENFIFDEKNILAAINLLKKMKENTENEEEIKKYSCWKEKIQELVKIKFKEIYDRNGENYYD